MPMSSINGYRIVNHISLRLSPKKGSAIRLMREAHETAQTLYQVKHGMLSEYLREQLKSSYR